MKRILFLLLLSTTGMLYSQPDNFKKNDFGVKVETPKVTVELLFYNSSTIRILKYLPGYLPKKESLSVIKTPIKIKFETSVNENVLTLKTDSLLIAIKLGSGNVSFISPENTALLKEQENGTVFTDYTDAGNKTFSVKQIYILDPNEAIYGLGQFQRGKMNQRGQQLPLLQTNLEDAVPFFQSVKGYGVFWDNYSPSVFTDNDEGTTFSSEVGDCCDYYFMYGRNADGVIAQMRGLTGEVPMFPLWTYGYWQSKERYKSEDEIVGVVKKYRELEVPLDGIIQDWQYWGDNLHWNGMEFLNPLFPQPQKMVNDIHQLNAHLIISIWASFGPETKPFAELKEKSMLLDFKTWPLSSKDVWPPDPNFPSGVKVYDPYNPEARDIYWKYLSKGLFSTGVDGWWMDSTDPDHLEIKPEDYDNKTFLGSFRKVRNAFPLMTVGGVYTHQRATASDKRVFILTRSAFAGQQRYGANTWSGDVVASWNALRKQITTGLNFSLTGIPYWNSDIGGFFLRNFKHKLDDPEYRELYVRWLQFGTFCPMMRSHGTDAPREIYQFGSKGEKHFDIINKFIQIRYMLLPYIYSTSWEVTANQSSMMRALMMDFSGDKNALDITDQFMFGKSIMVCPVTEPMYVKKSETLENKMEADFSTIKSRPVYLPKGTDWIDYWNWQKFEGGKTITSESPLNKIPLFVKAGSIIPVGPQVNFATEKKWDNLILYVYPGANGRFVLYEDENDNYNYEKGAYSTIELLWNDNKNILTIGKRNGTFKGMLKKRNFTIVYCSDPKAKTKVFATKTVTYTGEKLELIFK